MNIFQRFRRKKTAPVARDRLKILLAHERTVAGGSDLVAILRDEILGAVAKYVPVALDQVDVTMDRSDALTTLQIDVHIPISGGRRAAMGCEG